MSKLERFLGKPKKVVIAGEELELKPLTVKNLDIIVDLGSDDKRADAMRRLVVTTLKKSFPDEPEANFEDFSMEYFEDLVKGILAVNNLEVPEEKLKKAIEEQNVPKS